MKTIMILWFLVPLFIYAREGAINTDITTTEFERAEIVQMHPGTDMLEGLNKAIQEKNIKNAVILAGITYDPDNTGSPIGSLGVHEHWNNTADMEKD
jgi:hypothetical protein